MANKSYSISRRDIEDANRAVKRARDTVKKAKAERNSIASVATRAATVGAGAMASALLQARYGVTGIGPIPVDAAVGTGLLLASYYMNGATADVLEGLGEGALASFFTKWGAQMGAQWRQSSGANTTAPATVPGSAGVGNYGNWDVNAYGYGAYPQVSAPYGYPGVTNAQVVDYFRRGVG